MTAPAPVVLIVGGDPRDVETTASALDRRFGSDYRVLTAGSAADGLAELTGLARSGEQVALVAADLHLPDGNGVDFLERAAGLHSGVARILLFDLDDYHTRIPFRELAALQRASALGRIDGWMVKLDVGQGGGISFDPNFFIEWPKSHRPHQIRLEGGDSSSDSYCYP